MLTREMMLTIDLLGALGHEPLKMADAAEMIGSSYDQVHKIVKKLKKKGWIASKQGTGGGLYCVPRHLSLRDIIELWRGEIKLDRNPSRGEIAYEALLTACEQVPIRTFGG